MSGDEIEVDMSAFVMEVARAAKEQGRREAFEEAAEAYPVRIARLFHENYERLAPKYHYKTRKASAKPWDDVPVQNQALMIATVQAVFRALANPPQPAAQQAERQEGWE